MIKYQNFFFGYFYYCNPFGHKAIKCRAHARNTYMWNKDQSTYGFLNINYNSFAPLFDYNVVCYKCNNYGNITHFCRSDTIEYPRQNKWIPFPNKRKNPKDLEKEEIARNAK
jgi:hypothetical protein